MKHLITVALLVAVVFVCRSIGAPGASSSRPAPIDDPAGATTRPFEDVFAAKNDEIIIGVPRGVRVLTLVYANGNKSRIRIDNNARE